MIEYIKKQFLINIDKLIEFIEYYEYVNIKIHSNYISFGRDINSSPKSITLYTQDNEHLIVKDWSKNQSKDLFNYIVTNRNKTFKEVISCAKKILGIYNGVYYKENISYKVFGGFYSNVKNRKKMEIKTYDESILNEYIPCGNRRFLSDGISLEIQREFNIGYSVIDQSITIPLYTEDDNILAVKCRINKDPDDGENKYYYLYPGLASQSLYGYSHNYEYLESSDVIYVVESEKGVLQACTAGYRNFLGLSSGSISRKQVQMLLSLNCKKIVFLHDVGFDIESVMRNINMVKGYSKMKEIELGYWDYFDKEYDDKISCTDMGKEKLDYILKNEIKFV